ncbi:MAG: hypothetical protein M3T49_03140 [Candidatus Eremiobacteraeota bacterium]|nr:hypothetical protein [Candidatus Eremiobacteraeota bacterium]
MVVDADLMHRFERVRALRETLLSVLTNAACQDESARAMAVRSLEDHIPGDAEALLHKVRNRLDQSAADVLRPLVVDATNAVLLPAESHAESRTKAAAADFLERASLAVLADD